MTIFSSETTGSIATKLWWNGPWMAPFKICVRWSRLPTKMSVKLNLEKGVMKLKQNLLWNYWVNSKFGCGSHLGRRVEMLDTFLEENHPMTISSTFSSYWANGLPIATKLWWNGPWMAPFQRCVRWSRLPTKMSAKLKIEKRGDEI
jgi:hypothetical protein